MTQQSQRLGAVLTGQAGISLFAQIVGQSRVEVSLASDGQLLGNQGGLWPVATALVIGQQGEARLRLKRRAFELEQGSLGAIEQTGFQIVQGQRVLSTLMIGLVQVAARQQVLVHANGTFILAAPAKQISQREVQLRCVRVVLYRFDESINRLVLLFIEEEIQSLEIGLGCLPIFKAKLAQVQA